MFMFYNNDVFYYVRMLPYLVVLVVGCQTGSGQIHKRLAIQF